MAPVPGITAMDRIVEAAMVTGMRMENPRPAGGGSHIQPPTPAPASLSAGFSIHIVGSDLLPHNIEAADRGVYRQSALDGLPPATIRNYFSKISSPSLSLDDAQGEDEERG